MILKLGMHHWGLKIYKVCINGDPELTLIYSMAGSNLVTKAFLYEKVKTEDFSETIAASDMNVCRSRHLLKYMKICEY